MDAKPLKVLLIEDNPADARLIRELLVDTRPTYSAPPAFELLHVNRMAAGLAYLENIDFDVVLLDLSLSDSQGLNTFITIHGAAPDVPVVVLSGLNDENVAVQAMQHGAQDYLTKGDINTSLLMRSLRYAVERHRLWLELEKKTIALANSEARRRAIIENNADGIIIVNTEGIVRFVNPAAERILNRGQAELLDKVFDLPLVTGDTAELNVSRHNGGMAAVEMRLVETEWQGERVYQASLRDISEHKEARAEISEKAAELAEHNIALDEFNHTMAHQVQGLLSQMIGYASFIDMHYAAQLDEEAQRALSMVIQSGHKMNNVINELLLLASIRRDDIQVMPLDMGRIVAEVRKRLRLQIGQYEADLTLPDKWPIALGYASWIEEVWVNYINNGLKYGGRPPRLELGASTQPDGMIRFWVKDNGVGIAPADQKKLFKPHTRLRQRRVRGEGLGLSIVHRIVKKCAGQVGVESELGAGSTFWFTLPEASEMAELTNLEL
jgi:signal transduction histidine kinase